MNQSGAEVRAMEQTAVRACTPVQTAFANARAHLANYRHALEQGLHRTVAAPLFHCGGYWLRAARVGRDLLKYSPKSLEF